MSRTYKLDKDEIEQASPRRRKASRAWRLAMQALKDGGDLVPSTRLESHSWAQAHPGSRLDCTPY